MPDFHRPRLARSLAVVPAALVVLALAATPAAAEDCSKLIRQLKMDALDQLWGAVLQDTEQLLECDPRGHSASQARFYRGRALDRLRRRDEALKAYREFLDQHCRVSESDSILCEDARVSMLSLARDLFERDGDQDGLGVLLQGLKAGDSYTRIFACIQISQLRESKDAKAKALPTLVEAYRLEDDADFRNEICMAIMRIDPSKCGEGSATLKPDRPEPTFIRARVYDCATNKEKVSVNMPFSFAKAVIESISPELLDGIKEEGIDIENLWESLKKLDAHQKFEFKIDDGGRCEEIELWFE